MRTDGTLACWGDNDDGQATPPAGTFTQVSAGVSHTCGVRTDGTLACWGDERLRAGARRPRRHLHPGQRRLCSHLRGEDGRHTRLLGVQRRGAGDAPRRHLHPGQRGRCSHLRREDGRHPGLLGENSDGQATPPAGTFTQVSAGDCHTCGREDGRHPGLLGGERRRAGDAPRRHLHPGRARAAYHTCGLKTDGTLACWGENSYGQATPPAGTFSQVSAGDDHTCGVRTDGTLACWG